MNFLSSKILAEFSPWANTGLGSDVFSIRSLPSRDLESVVGRIPMVASKIPAPGAHTLYNPKTCDYDTIITPLIRSHYVAELSRKGSWLGWAWLNLVSLGRVPTLKKSWKQERNSMPGGVLKMEEGAQEKERTMASGNWEWPEVNSHQEDTDLSSTTTRNWIMSTTWMSFKADSKSANQAQLTIISALQEPELRSWPCYALTSYSWKCGVVN